MVKYRRFIMKINKIPKEEVVAVGGPVDWHVRHESFSRVDSRVTFQTKIDTFVNIKPRNVR